MDRPKAYICLVWLVGVVSAQTGQQGLTRPTPAVLVTPATNRAQLEPVILTRPVLTRRSSLCGLLRGSPHRSECPSP
jgi:hypothetical protein